jgi:hypothetical protein
MSWISWKYQSLNLSLHLSPQHRNCQLVTITTQWWLIAMSSLREYKTFTATWAVECLIDHLYKVENKAWAVKEGIRSLKWEFHQASWIHQRRIFLLM